MGSISYQMVSMVLVISMMCCTSFSYSSFSGQQCTQRNVAQIRKNVLRQMTAMSGSVLSGTCVTYFEELLIPTKLGIYLVDITPDIRRIVAESGVKSGTVTVLSRHTTTAITINEMEGRLVDDTRQFLLKLVPAACKLY